jgi:hypothetical protein
MPPALAGVFAYVAPSVATGATSPCGDRWVRAFSRPPGSRSAAVPAWIKVGMHGSSEAGDGAALSHDRLQRLA